ncbi:integrase arm-type DNA-binding domain-containing protein [Ruegeria sp. 1NDH52C]|uniref:Integrase arm-type DNA-binding domain-containing protein n=1 Tax=Ruegeria alba TaxID=2916756 RepID=A0ABS9NTG5_9RHOB|nr:site-specific integrase [Ruegeria alba]MCG6556915.1 integrase arm-type DNA-binding domain-containing protein [Ruegeria alba]
MPAKHSRSTNRLSARKVETASEPGYYIDGGGLLLHISNNGGKRWLLRFTSPLTGKRREMGLGPAGERGKVSLADARAAADAARRLVQTGVDPIQHRDEEVKRRRTEAARAAPKTFGAFAAEWLDGNLSQFRNPKHRQQWRNTLTTYAAPIWDTPLPDVTTDNVLAALRPIWTDKNETARRVRGRIERLLDAASAVGLRTGENPARWRGHLANLLPPKPKGTEKHHRALPWKDLPAFIADLRTRDGIAALALEFGILTVSRSGMVRGATWAEIDMDGARWTIPGRRMKAKRDHRVPLTPRALEILRQMEAHRPADDPDGAALVFPGTKRGKPLSDMTLAAVLRRMGRDTITVHGFRSTFRDWAEDSADAAYGTIRSAMAHTIGDKVDAAYRRSDAFDRRRDLMAQWEAYMNAPLPGTDPTDAS